MELQHLVPLHILSDTREHRAIQALVVIMS
jgi:hypothetical protein